MANWTQRIQLALQALRGVPLAPPPAPTRITVRKRFDTVTLPNPGGDTLDCERQRVRAAIVIGGSAELILDEPEGDRSKPLREGDHLHLDFSQFGLIERGGDDTRASIVRDLLPDGWKHDCQGKQDYDADLLSLSCRYYPEHYDVSGRHSVMAAIVYAEGQRTLVRAEFFGRTASEAKSQAEAWTAARVADMVAALSWLLVPGDAEDTVSPEVR